MPRSAESINCTFVFDPDLISTSAQLCKGDDLWNGTYVLQASQGDIRERGILGGVRFRLFAHGNLGACGQAGQRLECDIFACFVAKKTPAGIVVRLSLNNNGARVRK